MLAQLMTLAFEDGREIFDGVKTVRSSVRACGDLVLPSGWIVACDPLGLPQDAPFERRVSAGRYPVTISVAVSPGPSRGERVACAQLSFSRRAVASTILATIAGQDLGALAGEELYGYGVDAGAGCFADVSVAKRITACDDESERIVFSVLTELESAPIYSSAWSNFIVGPDAANIVAFKSGYGDGTYASYWGFDADGEVVCLVTDFQIYELKP